MPEVKGSSTYLRPDLGEASTADLGSTVVPFKDLDRRTEREGILVQVKVLTPDDGEGVRVMSAMENALKGLTVSGKPVVTVLTRDNIEMSYADLEKLSNLVAPMILRRLGIRDGIGGNFMGIAR